MKTHRHWFAALCLAFLSLSMLGAVKGPLPYSAKKILGCDTFACEIAPPKSVPGGILFSIHNGTLEATYQSLWFSDGTQTGTKKLVDLCTDGSYNYLMSSPREDASLLVGDALFFFAPYATDGGCAWGLWRFDAADQTVTRIRDQSTGRLAYHNQKVLFLEGPDYGLENTLFSLNSSMDGFELVRQFDGIISGFMPWGDRIILTGKVGEGMNRYGEIWSTNGLAAETKRLALIYFRYCEVAPKGFTALKGSLIFLCYDSPDGHFDLWETDGAASGTVKICSLGFGDGFDVGPFYGIEMVTVNGRAFFPGWHTVYQTDGTAAGTRQVYTAGYDMPFNRISWFFPYKGALYFYGEPLGYGRLNKTYGRNDGEEEGEIIAVSPAEADTGPYCYEPLMMLGDRLYFQHDYPGYDYRLTDSWYWTDGTIVNSLSGPADDYQNPCDLTLFKGRLFFSAYDKGDNEISANNELWVDDGISTHRVVDLDEIGWEDRSDVEFLTVSGDDLFFVNRIIKDTRLYNDELWVYAPMTEKIYLPSVRR